MSEICTVEWHNSPYPAQRVAGGAAFELFSAAPQPHFLPNPRPGATYPYRRFVHVSEVSRDGAPVIDTEDSMLSAPLAPGIDLSIIREMSQSPHASASVRRLLSTVRASALIRRGTRMIKSLSPRQAATLLHSEPVVAGFCFREHDVAHLRTPADRQILDGDPHPGDDVSFALRWRAADPSDFAVPSAADLAGLMAMPGSERRGGPVLGTGFVPSKEHLIPEFVTAGMTDLPLSARSELVAYTPDGTEIAAFLYMPERAAWTRTAGARWRRLLSAIPGHPEDQEWFPVPPADHVGHTGAYRDRRHPAIPDPPHEFRVRSKTTTARFVVSDVKRHSTHLRWRDVDCTVLGSDRDWLRLRLSSPNDADVQATRADCVERGIYECWAPAAEIHDVRHLEHAYPA